MESSKAELKRKAAAYRAVRHRAHTVGEDVENAYIEGYEQCSDDTFRWLIQKFGDMTVATQYFNEMKGVNVKVPVPKDDHGV